MKPHHLRKIKIQKELTQRFKELIFEGYSSKEAYKLISEEFCYSFATLYARIDAKTIIAEVKNEKFKLAKSKMPQYKRTCRK
jgi:hypothetical protein